MQLKISLVLQLQEGGDLNLKRGGDIGGDLTLKHFVQDGCRRPMMPLKSASGVNGGPAGARHRSLGSLASPDRRVIFPSLHGASASSSPQRNASRARSHPESKEPDDSVEISPRNVDTNNIQGALFRRANSLDGISIPLPDFTVAAEGKSDQSDEDLFTTLRPLNEKPRSQRLSDHTNIPIPPAPQCKGAPRPRAISLSLVDNISKPSIFGDAARHRTYYPAASAPTPFDDKRAKPKHSEPRASILRKKSDLTAQASLAALTLASPASLKSLQDNPRQKEGDRPNFGIGESEYDLEHISDSPKIIPRTEGKQGKLPRPQSNNTVVSKGEDLGSLRDSEASSSLGSTRSCVSRHQSLECLPNNRRTAFDPHVVVYEFPVTAYERKGGEKWFSADELTQFKREAMQRIRLRGTKTLIPTGTGRLLAVSKGRATLDKTSINGVVSFNHPALGCEEESDAESRSPRMSPVALRDNAAPAAAAHIKNILVVDSHEIFLGLFTKSLKHMVPHACVATARSSEEAMTRIEAARRAFPLSDGGSTHGFDIVIIEERLRSSSPALQRTGSGAQTQAGGEESVQRRSNMTSGSALIRYLVESEHKFGEGRGGSLRHSLMIGVSARLAQDREKIKKSGADLVWGKPPPEMNAALRNRLLALLMKKRNSN